MKRVPLAIRRYWNVGVIPRLPAIVLLLTLFIVAFALLWPASFTSNQLFAIWSDSDLVVSHWPAALIIQRTFVQEHQLSFWNPYFGGGLPLAANPLTAFFYPPTYLVYFLSLRDFYLVLIIGHLVLAGLGMLLLARRVLGLPRFSALVAAVSYMATPKLLAHLGAGHITMVQTVAWYPWLALAGWATMRDPRRWGGWLSVCFALTLLAGHPQVAYYGFLMVAGMAAWLLVKRWRREGWRTLWPAVAGLVAAVSSSLLLAAIYLLPLVELITRSTRQASINVEDVFPILSFLRLLISQPAPGTGWETMVAPGWIVLALALLASVARWRKAWPLVLGIVLIASLSVGNASPFYVVISHVLPEFTSLRGVARIWFVALVQIALLAGLGSDIVLCRIRSALDWLSRGRQSGVSLLMAGAGGLMVFTVAFSLITIDVGYTHVNNVSLVTMPSNLARAATQLAGSGKVYDEQENILQASAVELSAHLADGQDPLLIEAYIAYMQRAGGYFMDGYNLRIPYDRPGVQPDARLLGLMNVSIVVSQRPLTDSRLVLIGKIDNTLLYRNTADAGAAYLVGVDQHGNPPSLAQLQLLKSSVRMVTRADEQSVFSFSTSMTAYLVIATTAYPGWTASLDGHAVPIQLIAGVLPAIKVSPGTHILSYSYSPLSVREGSIFSVIGLLAVFAWCALGQRLKSGRVTKRNKPLPQIFA